MNVKMLTQNVEGQKVKERSVDMTKKSNNKKTKDTLFKDFQGFSANNFLSFENSKMNFIIEIT